MTVWLGCFRGQGGYLTSMGVARIASRAKAAGIEAQTYPYSAWEEAEADARAKRKSGCKIALLGYSLGCTAATFLQTLMPIDLVLCVAESKFGQNHPIDKQYCKRAVLWWGAGPLSDAGRDAGFTAINKVDSVLSRIPLLGHLHMDFAPSVVAGVMDELTKLKGTTQ